MISLVTHAADLPRVRGPFSLRIAAAAKAYGLEAPFLDVWQGNGCWFSRMDGVLTFCRRTGTGRPGGNPAVSGSLRRWGDFLRPRRPPLLWA